MLEDKAVPVLVCLTYADKLYAEHMGKDGSHPDPKIIAREVTKETEVRKVFQRGHIHSLLVTIPKNLVSFIKLPIL